MHVSIFTYERVPLNFAQAKLWITNNTIMYIYTVVFVRDVKSEGVHVN